VQTGGKTIQKLPVQRFVLQFAGDSPDIFLGNGVITGLVIRMLFAFTTWEFGPDVLTGGDPLLLSSDL
jgi:hypothetical protein